MQEALENQIERFAPGFRDTILARSIRRPQDLERDNPNCTGGDISSGPLDGLRLFFRPRSQLDPFKTTAEGVFICSAAAPPAPGVHGMCGYHGAQSAIRWLERGAS